MMKTYPTLAAKLADQALCLSPSHLHALANGLEMVGPVVDRPYTVERGVAVISILGALGNRAADRGWFEATYEGIRDTLDAAVADPAVRAILLDIDSPGGMATGAMETAKHVRAASSRKPVIAYVDGVAASAAYAIASGAKEIVTAPSATLGSIGVVALHMDMSAAFKDAGLKPTLIFSGAHKTDGSPLKPLEMSARGRMQGHIDEVYSLFIKTVGDLRPSLGEKGARDTEAGVYLGRQAVDARLADRVGSRRDAIALALGELPQTKQQTTPTARHVVAPVKAKNMSYDEGIQEGRNQERARIAAILGSPTAEGRMGVAMTLAFESDMTADQAEKVLRKMPAATTATVTPIRRFDAGKIGLSLVSEPPAQRELSETERGRQMFLRAFGKSAN